MIEDENELVLRDKLAISIFSSLLENEKIAIDCYKEFISDKDKKKDLDWANQRMENLTNISYMLADLFRKHRLKVFK